MNERKGRVAVVTGAGTGIGRGIARALARQGCRVVAVGRRLDKVKETADLIAKGNGRALAVSADVSKAADVARIVEECRAAFGAIDILINNAGVHVPGGILKVTEEQWDWIISVNLKGVFLCSKAVAPGMLERKWGRVINIASVGAITPSLNAAYCATKGAVVTLTKSMALELSPGGVTVNAICPGTTVTEMTRERLEDPAVRTQQLAKSRVGFFAEPADIAAGAVYLASEEARFVTGSVLVIDGGWTIT